jgi:DNA repair protein RadC
MSIYKQYDLPLSFEDSDPPAGPPSAAIRAREVREQSIVDQAFAILSRRYRRGEVLSDPDTTKAFLRMKLADQLNEVFGCIFLDNRHRIIMVEDLFVGTIDGASVYTRVIVQKALVYNAAAILAYHNHPLC